MPNSALIVSSCNINCFELVDPKLGEKAAQDTGPQRSHKGFVEVS